MTKYFSPSKLGFFDDSLKKSYDVAGSWPDDAVEITDVAWQTFLDTPTEGKQLGSDSSGGPAWVDIPAPTPEDLIQQAELQKQYLIDQANGYIDSKQWPSKLALERLSDADKALFNQWLDYLDALEAVDTSGAPEIAWPKFPA